VAEDTKSAPKKAAKLSNDRAAREAEIKGQIDELRRELVELRKEDPSGKVGLALSGGGYRASLFHLGALWRLNELGWLKMLHLVTSVSGGSIVAAYLGLRWTELKFDDDGVATNFDEIFVKPMRDMFATTIDIPTIMMGLLNPVGSARGRVDGRRLVDGTIDTVSQIVGNYAGRTTGKIAAGLARPFGAVFGTGIDAGAVAWDSFNRFPAPGELLIKTYDRLLFHGKTLQDLPDPDEGHPMFNLYATNMQTGSSVRMNRDELSDYKLGKVSKPEVQLAKAVAASSGFPPFYCPIELEIPLEKWSGGEELSHRDRLRRRVDLGDGAVYDNMGLTMLLQQKCDTILVSDAGDSLDIIDALSFEWLGQTVRTLLVSMDQNNLRRADDLYRRYYYREIKGAYWSIASDIKEPKGWGRQDSAKAQRGKSLADLHREPELLEDNEKTRAVGEMRTRLNRFTDEEQENLINWGYAIADARMRRYVIDEKKTKIVPGKLPCPNHLG
jgi:NTE family protein